MSDLPKGLQAKLIISFVAFVATLPAAGGLMTLHMFGVFSGLAWFSFVPFVLFFVWARYQGIAQMYLEFEDGREET